MTDEYDTERAELLCRALKGTHGVYKAYSYGKAWRYFNGRNCFFSVRKKDAPHPNKSIATSCDPVSYASKDSESL